MSILFLPPQSAGSITIADATETTSGKIRIATSAEATAGTNDVTAMTPAKVKSVVDASVVGGVTYQGTFDASTPADLSNATKGDLYIISVAGTYAGKTWAVGDHLLVNADMGGTLDSAKIDKVDNTDAVTSVAGRTGAITLSSADVSGLATVATTGAYSDLSGTPTLGTAAALDVGTGASNVVQLDGSGLLPAVDGSQLTNLPAPTLDLNDLTDVTFTAGAGINNYVLTYDSTSGLWGAEAVPSAPDRFYRFGTINVDFTVPAITDNRHQYYEIGTGGITLTIPNASSSAVGGVIVIRNHGASSATISCPTADLSDGSASTSFTLDSEQTRAFVWASANRLHEITDSASSSLNDLTDVTITSASAGEVLRYNGSAWVDAQLAYSDLSGTPTLATVATTGAYSDLSGTPTNVSTFTNDAGYLTDITAENLGDLANVDLTGLADGEIIIYNATSGKWEANPPPAPLATTTSVGLIEIAENAEATAGTATDKALVPRNISSITTAQLDNSAGTMLESANNLSDLANATTARTNLGLGTVAPLDVGTAANNVVQLNGSAQLPAVDGSLLTGVVADISGASIGDLSDVTITAAATGEVLRYNGTAWVDAQLAYTDVSGLGTVAPLDVGTAANNVVQLNGSAQLPAVDGSLLTGVVADLSGATLDDLSDVSYPAAPTKDQLLQWNTSTSKWEPVDATTVTSDSPGSTYSVTTHKGLEEVYILSPSTSCTVSIPTAATAGEGFKYQFKLMTSQSLTINDTIDGVSGFTLTAQYSSLTIVSSGSAWFVI
jgi:hypothetical protein